MTEEHAEQQETFAVSDCESVFEEVGEQYDEQESTNFSGDFDGEGEAFENLNEDESEGMGM